LRIIENKGFHNVPISRGGKMIIRNTIENRIEFRWMIKRFGGLLLNILDLFVYLEELNNLI